MPSLHIATDTSLEKKLPWVVQKFGGTSLGKFSLNIVDNVIVPYSQSHKVVAVCSARSLDTKEGGTTNRLLRAAQEALDKGSSESLDSLIMAIESDHIGAMRGCVKSPQIARSLTKDIQDECRRVATLLTAAATMGEVTERCLDRVVSTGERLSAKVLCAMLQDRGISAEFVDLSDAISCADKHQALDQEFYGGLAQHLGGVVKHCPARVAVVTGYFGTVPGGLLHSIGRGYTDLCSVLLAAGIPGAQLQVWKELDGIFTADPRCVTTARLVETLSPAEAAELTFYGAEVIHPLAMKQAVYQKLPIAVKGVMNPHGLGTLVVPHQDLIFGDDALAIDTSRPGFGSAGTEATVMTVSHGPATRPIALTSKRGIIVIRVHSTERCSSHSFFLGVFRTLEKWRLSADLMSTSSAQISMALEPKMSHSHVMGGADGAGHDVFGHDLSHAIRELHLYGRVEVLHDMAIVCVVGRQEQQASSGLTGNISGLASTVFAMLGRNNIPTAMMLQGASKLSVTCVMADQQVQRASCILHDCLCSPNALMGCQEWN
ncbi:aspartokinase [Colletotrichum zoysiae]|uniref:Aspartokinase n=1 Tax=Colletotrichum zoysiae TaxID=1216348 RepID=A0AAD9HFG5_9PEZI|nr:aspartokinase [Colletotrichum zoysiae]